MLDFSTQALAEALCIPMLLRISGVLGSPRLLQQVHEAHDQSQQKNDNTTTTNTTTVIHFPSLDGGLTQLQDDAGQPDDDNEEDGASRSGKWKRRIIDTYHTHLKLCVEFVGRETGAVGLLSWIEQNAPQGLVSTSLLEKSLSRALDHSVPSFVQALVQPPRNVSIRLQEAVLAASLVGVSRAVAAEPFNASKWRNHLAHALHERNFDIAATLLAHPKHAESWRSALPAAMLRFFVLAILPPESVRWNTTTDSLEKSTNCDIARVLGIELPPATAEESDGEPIFDAMKFNDHNSVLLAAIVGLDKLRVIKFIDNASHTHRMLLWEATPGAAIVTTRPRKNDAAAAAAAAATAIAVDDTIDVVVDVLPGQCEVLELTSLPNFRDSDVVAVLHSSHKIKTFSIARDSLCPGQQAGGCSDLTMEVLAKHCDALEALDLGYTQITPDALEAIVKKSNLTELKIRSSLVVPLISASLILDLAEKQGFKNLRVFVGNRSSTDEMLAALGACAGNNLLSVQLSSAVKVTDAGIEALVESARSLTSLDFSYIPGITDRTCEAIATHIPSSIQEINIAYSGAKRVKMSIQHASTFEQWRITSQGISQLAFECANLRIFDASGMVAIDEDTLAMLLACCQLEVLSFSHTVDYQFLAALDPATSSAHVDNRISDALFLEAPEAALRRLRRVDVSFSKGRVTDASVTRLVESAANNLEFLDVMDSKNEIGDPTLLALATHCSTSLTFLDMGLTSSVTDTGVEALLASCRQLELLDLSHCSSLTALPFVHLPPGALAQLHFLSLHGLTSFSDRALSSIVRSCSGTLRRLFVDGARHVSDFGLIELSRCESLSELSLNATSTLPSTLQAEEVLPSPSADDDATDEEFSMHITDRGLSQLLSGCPRLERVSVIGRTLVTNAIL